MAPKFKRTYTAAQVEMQSNWELIEAIAEDALEEDVPISGIDSCLAAKAALEAAGNAYSDETVKHLCLVAKFDSESTLKQKRVWRRYGWTIVRRVASAGWAQEAAYDLLVGDHKTFREVMDAVGHSRVRAHPGTLDDRWAAWLGRLESVINDGAELADETDKAKGVTLGGYGQLGHLMYERIVGDQLDAELRELLDSQEA